MNETTFVDTVKKYFGYLQKDYEFEVTSETNSQIRPQTDGMVEFTSKSTVVVIDSETGYAAVWFYRIKDGKKYYLDPVSIHEYLNTTKEEKELLLSSDPENQPIASALFNQKFLLNQPKWKSRRESVLEDLEKRLKNYANWLKEHADLCLTGNFSRWPEFYEYKIYRARADHLRRGDDELGYTRVKDADGNWKLIKQSIFKDKLEHVEKLKREFPN